MSILPSASDSASDSATYQGIDVSHYQSDVDWSAVKASGAVFGFAKATEGTSYVDPKFATNWAGMKSAGLVRGAYHFLDANVDASAQADHFIATVQLAPGDLPPVLDVEVSGGMTAAQIQAAVQTWLTKVEAAFGVKPILYSSKSFFETYLPSGFSQYPMWLANYTSTPPAAPGDWAAWTFWQYSQSGTVAGVDGAVDQDTYQGTVAAWQGLLMPVT